MSKQQILLDALQSGRTVTRLTALGAFKIANLTAEIGTLRRKGYVIVAETGNDGTGAKYTKWTYHGTVRQKRPNTAALRAAVRAKISARRAGP